MHVTMCRLQKRTRDGNDVFSCCNVCHYIVWWHHRRREQVCEWHIEHTHTHRGETETHTSFRFTDVSEGETVESGAFHSECVSFLYPSLTLSITHKHTHTHQTGHSDLFNQCLKLQIPSFILKGLLCMCVCIVAAILLHRKLPKRLIHHLRCKICDWWVRQCGWVEVERVGAGLGLSDFSSPSVFR